MAYSPEPKDTTPLSPDIVVGLIAWGGIMLGLIACGLLVSLGIAALTAA